MRKQTMLLLALFVVPFLGFMNLSNQAYGYCAGPLCAKGAVFSYTYGGKNQIRITTSYGTMYGQEHYPPFYARPAVQRISCPSPYYYNGIHCARPCKKRNFRSRHPKCR